MRKFIPLSELVGPIFTGTFYASVFLILCPSDVNRQLVRYLLCAVSCYFILLSIAMIDGYLIDSNVLTKIRYLGLVSYKFDLKDVVDLKIISLTSGLYKNPLTILRLFTSNPKYSKFRKITLQFDDGCILTIDERVVQDADFNLLLKKLKYYVS